MAAVDITTIGIEYDTSGLEKGTRAQDKTRESANKLGDSVDKTEKSFSSLNKILGIAAGALAAVGGVMLAKQFTETADAVSLMDARLKMATGSLQDFKQAQKDIYAISQANNVGIKETTSLYTKLSDPVRRLGGTSKEVAAIVDSFATSLRVGGASAQEASAATLQFAQAMASGKLQGDEFRSISEASPRFMKALAEGMGKPIEKLKEMSSEGKLTADVVGNALVKSLAQLKKEAAGLPDTVSGAITRFKNDVILAVGEISNSQGFTVGFAGLIEQARGLIPVIKDEVMGAFVAVNGWIERNKEEMSKVWEVAKGIVGDVWEVAKGAASVVGFVIEWAIQSGLVKTTFETIRFLIAGFQDGVTAIGAGFAYVGSQIFQMVLMPLQKVLETTAKVAGVFDEQMASNLRAVAKEIDDFSKGGENYAKSVADAFGKGDSAVGRLNAELEKTNSETKKLGTESKKATDLASGGYSSLKSKIKETDDEAKKLSIHEMAAQAGRKAGHKAEREFLKELEKDFKQFSSDQISRTKDVTKEIISGIQEQSKNYLVYNKSLDDHAQRMSDMNTLAQLEIDTLGMSSVQRNTLIEQKKIELNLEKQIREIRALNMAEGEKNLLIDKANSQALIDKSTAQLRAQQNEWSKFYGEIYNGLSDSLYRGFEAGKGFGRSFLDSIKNLFKTNIIKIAVQAVMGTGSSIVSSLAGAASGSGGGSSSLLSMGKTLWDGFSLAGTVGGGIGQLGSMLGSTTLSSFASGMTGTASGTIAGMGPTVAGSSSGLGALSGSGAASAGSSAAAALPIVGWIAAGMMANNSLFDKGWGAKPDKNTKLAGAASGLAANLFTDTIQKWFGLSDKTASMLTGSAVVNRLFGYKNPELQQSELSGSFGANGYSASTRDVYKQQGGLFRGDKWSESINKADSSAMTEAFTAVKEAAKGYASVLGLSTSALDTFTKDFKVNLSITGDAAKDAEANQKILSDILAGVTNDLSNLLAPALSGFAKEGETASATLQRLASGLAGVNEIMIGVGFDKFAQSLEGANASQRLLDLTGGIENLATGAQYFFENFLTDAEKIKPAADLVAETMARLGKSSVDTVPEFRELVKSLDLSSESGAKMYAELIAIAPQFKAVADYTRILNGELTETERIAKETADAAKLEADTLSQRVALQDEYNQLTMTSAELLALQRDTIFDSNKALYDSIQTEKLNQAEKQEATRVAREIAQERLGLQNELNELTLTETQLLDIKRNSYAAANRDLFDQIQIEKQKALQEQKNAVMYEEMARAQAEQQAVIQRQQDDAARQAQDYARQMQEAANRVAQAWQGMVDNIYDEVRRIRGLGVTNTQQGFVNAQSDFAIATAQARSGDQKAYSLLPELSKAMLAIAEQQAPTLQALRMIQAQTAASLLATSSKLGFQLPSFAVGTDYVPQDMIAQIHEGERIVPKAYNNSSNKSDSADKTLIRDLIQRVEMLSFELKAIAGHTSSTARNLDRVIVDDKVQIGTPQGEPIQTTAV